MDREGYLEKTTCSCSALMGIAAGGGLSWLRSDESNPAANFKPCCLRSWVLCFYLVFRRTRPRSDHCVGLGLLVKVWQMEAVPMIWAFLGWGAETAAHRSDLVLPLQLLCFFLLKSWF